MAILRSLAFYVAFYLGTVFFVLRALFWLPFDRGQFRKAVHGWSRWHRWCVEHLLGIDIVCHGQPLDQPVLYAIKHESFFEAIDAPTLFRLPAVFAKQELFALPGWGRRRGCTA